jgi:uncharacterized protein (DUF2141 family)
MQGLAGVDVEGRRCIRGQGPATALGTRFYRPNRAPGKHRRRLGVLALLALLLPVGADGQTAAAPRAGACGAPNALEGPRLRVAVTGARRAAGNVTVTLYGSRREDFLARGGRLARQRVPLAGPAAEACFALSAPGDYAVAVYHDENDDRDFNRNALGLPGEGYGFSNDAPTTLGLPDFDAVRFTLPPGETRVTVRLRY